MATSAMTMNARGNGRRPVHSLWRGYKRTAVSGILILTMVANVCDHRAANIARTCLEMYGVGRLKSFQQKSGETGKVLAFDQKGS